MSHRITAVAVLVALAALLAAALATAGSAAPARTLHFRDKELAFTLDPQGPPTVGTRLILTKALFNRGAQFGKASGARVGSAEIVCTVVSRKWAQCSVTAHVPTGQIVAFGAMTITENGLSRNHFALVGGAGAFAGARGEIDSRDVNQSSSLIDIHLAAS